MYCKINKTQEKILVYYECRNMILARYITTGTPRYARVCGLKQVDLFYSENNGKFGRRITFRHLLRKLRCIVE